VCKSRSVGISSDPAGPSSTAVLFLALAKIYTLMNTVRDVEFVPDDSTTGELDPNDRLKLIPGQALFFSF
jgi:hypothetical protein